MENAITALLFLKRSRYSLRRAPCTGASHELWNDTNFQLRTLVWVAFQYTRNQACESRWNHYISL